MPAIGPKVGWAVLHLFCRTGVPAVKGQGSTVDVEAVLEAIKEAQAAQHQVVTVAMLGHKADIGFMVLGPDMWELRRFQSAVQSAGLAVGGSYVSLTEVSEYAAGVPEEMKQARLYPNLPPEKKPAFCFYPMSKRRGEKHNWYSLGFEQRRELMVGHGHAARDFRGRVLQLVTGSTGLDDWEWGVTLFGEHPDDLKQCVYEMRFDPASAHYAEFGPFWTGVVAPPEKALGVVL